MRDAAEGGFGASLAAAIGRRRWPVVVLVLFVAWTGFAGIGYGLLVLAAVEARHWPKAEAEITRVTPRPDRPTARTFDLELVVQLPGRGRVEGETVALYRPRGGWSNPEPNPRIGDRIEVLVDPDAPHRMRPVSTDPPPWKAVLNAAAFGTAHLGFLAVLITLWRARRSARPAPPTGG